jgi:DsbC/DsbD-like thiol-disulfide interchange protein
MKTSILFLTFGLLLNFGASAQIEKPIVWSYAAKKTGKGEATLYLRATIENGWHIYSQNMKDGGPVKTTFTFLPSKEYTKIGKTIEPKPITKFEQTFDMNVSYFEKSVTFQQKVKLNKATTTVKGKLEYMVCNDSQCLPPDEINFSIPVK